MAADYLEQGRPQAMLIAATMPTIQVCLLVEPADKVNHNQPQEDLIT
jgi:hypothetical protein